jgi:transcription factor TGA
VEEHSRQTAELRTAVNQRATDDELQKLVDQCLAHYDELFKLKSQAAKMDVFHLVSGMWKTPAERCFMWMGGFRPSEMLKVRTLCE